MTVIDDQQARDAKQIEDIIQQILNVAEENKKLSNLRLLWMSAQTLTDKLPTSTVLFLTKLEQIKKEIIALINWGIAELQITKFPNFDELVMEVYKQLSLNNQHPVKSEVTAKYLAQLYVTSSNFIVEADEEARQKINYNNPALFIPTATNQLGLSIEYFCNNVLIFPNNPRTNKKLSLADAPEPLDFQPVTAYLSQSAAKPSISQRAIDRIKRNVNRVVDYITKYPKTITYFLKAEHYREDILNNPALVDRLISSGKPEILNTILNTEDKINEVLTRIESTLHHSTDAAQFADYYKMLLLIFDFNRSYIPNSKVEDIYIKFNMKLLNELLTAPAGSPAYKQAYDKYAKVLELEKTHKVIVDEYTDKMEKLRTVIVNLPALAITYVNRRDNPAQVGTIPLQAIIGSNANLFSKEIEACLLEAKQPKTEPPRQAMAAKVVASAAVPSQISPVQLLLKFLTKGIFKKTKETEEMQAVAAEQRKLVP